MPDNNDKKDFRTHIKEPRWQQIASIIVVLAVIGLWIWLALR